MSNGEDAREVNPVHYELIYQRSKQFNNVPGGRIWFNNLKFDLKDKDRPYIFDDLNTEE